MAIGTGWLDMQFDVAMRAECLAILFAQDAKIDMLVATGVLSRPDEPTKLPELTPGAMRGMRRS